jgi:ABC-2 type transport system permease protein
VLLMNGLSASEQWTQLSWFQMSMGLLFHLLTVHMLWHAPLYCWLLLVSGWARRAVILWALLPPLVICVVEKIAFNTMHCAHMLQYRLMGPEMGGFTAKGNMPMNQMTLSPGEFIASPGLWIGLVVAGAFFIAAVRLRRYRGPI